MDPVTASIVIDRPQAEVFEYLLDVANRPEYSDHYLGEFHLTRTDSYGKGAGARFRLKTRRNRFGWADLTITDVEPPRRIAEAGRGGKFNRVRLLSVYSLAPAPGGTTRVTLSVETEPATLADRLLEGMGMRGWVRRQIGHALRRLRAILEGEEASRRGPRATIAGL